jgi:hypothetical protein
VRYLRFQSVRYDYTKPAVRQSPTPNATSIRIMSCCVQSCIKLPKERPSANRRIRSKAMVAEVQHTEVKESNREGKSAHASRSSFSPALGYVFQAPGCFRIIGSDRTKYSLSSISYCGKRIARETKYRHEVLRCRRNVELHSFLINPFL